MASLLNGSNLYSGGTESFQETENVQANHSALFSKSQVIEYYQRWRRNSSWYSALFSGNFALCGNGNHSVVGCGISSKFVYVQQSGCRFWTPEMDFTREASTSGLANSMGISVHFSDKVNLTLNNS